MKRVWTPKSYLLRFQLFFQCLLPRMKPAESIDLLLVFSANFFLFTDLLLFFTRELRNLAKACLTHRQCTLTIRLDNILKAVMMELCCRRCLANNQNLEALSRAVLTSGGLLIQPRDGVELNFHDMRGRPTSCLLVLLSIDTSQHQNAPTTWKVESIQFIAFRFLESKSAMNTPSNALHAGMSASLKCISDQSGLRLSTPARRSYQA